MKNSKYFLLLIIMLFVNSSSISYAQSLQDVQQPLVISETIGQEVSPFQLINFDSPDIKKVEYLEWSNNKFPLSNSNLQISSEVKKVKETNLELRRKFQNRSDLFKDTNQLSTWDDQLEQAVVSEEMVLYGYYTASEFNMFERTFDKDYNKILKDTSYGIDHGYFIGSLTERKPNITTERPYDLLNERIELELTVPKGSFITRIGPLDDSLYMLPRNLTFEYQEKSIVPRNQLQYINIKAKIIDNSDLEECMKTCKDNLQTKYPYEGVKFDLNYLGLNAGSILYLAEKVMPVVDNSKALQTVFQDPCLTYYDVIFSNSTYANGSLFEKMYNKLSIDEQRINFNTAYMSGDVGYTIDMKEQAPPFIGSNLRIGYTNGSENKAINNNLIIEDYAGTFIHEAFHYACYNTEYFKKRKMFSSDSSVTFEDSVTELKKKEEEILAKLLEDEYCKSSMDEFIAESFMAKYHPMDSVKKEFPEKVPLTNRFLDNLYDFDAPTSPKNVREVSVDGNNAILTFDHSSDNVSVDKYLIYKKKTGDGSDFQPCKTVLTKKDTNGLSLANPSDKEPNITATIGGLEQHTEYEFYVKSFDEAQNESDCSNIIKVKTKDIEPPKIEGNLNASTIVSTVAFLSLPKATDNVGVEKLELTRREESLFGTDRLLSPSSEKIFSLPANTKNYTDTTIKKGTRYTYTMTAIDAAGNESKPSNEVVIQTNDDDDRKQNEDKAENTTSSSATLNWSGAFEGVSSSGFSLFSWIFKGGNWVFGGVTSVVGTATSSLVSLTPGSSHQFLVVPVDDKGDPLADGLKISVDAPPIKVTNVEATTIKQTLIALQWDAPLVPEQTKPELTYDVYRNDQLIDTVSETEYVDGDVDPETTYTYQVIPKLEGAVKSSPLSIDTLAPYKELLIRLASTSSTYGGQVITLGDTVNLEPFENTETQFIHLSYNQAKKAYQLKTKELTHVLGVSEDQAKQVISSENMDEDHQYWKIKDSVDDFVKLENVAYPNFMLDIFTEPRLVHPVLGIKPAEVARDSQQFKVLQDTEPPTTPKNLTASTITDHSVSLSWEASEDDVGVMYYDIYQGSKRISRVNGKTLSTIMTDLDSLTNYHFTVKAVDGSNNESQPSNMVEVSTLPKAPKNLKITNIKESTVRLSWQVNETSPLVTGYNVYQDGTFIQTVPKDKMNYLVENLMPDREYTFTVKTKTETVLSEHSNKETVKTLDKNPEVTVSDITTNSVKINWEPEKSSSVWYEIYQDDRLIDTTGSKTTSYTATNLLPATAYKFSVITRWDNARTATLNSNKVSAVTNPMAPVNLHAEDITETSVNISWEDGGNGNELIGYEIYQDNRLIHETDKQTLNYLIENLDATTSYDFTIRAKIKNGVLSESSNVLILKIEDHWDKVEIPINLSQLKEGDQGRGYSFINNRLLFNESATKHRYVLSSQNISNASIHIKSNITTHLSLDNLQIHADQPITIEDDASVTILLKEKSQNKLTATKGAVISTGKQTNLTIDAEGENDQVGRLDVVAPPNMHAIGGETSYVELNAKNGIRSVTYNVHPIKSSNSYNQGNSYMLAMYLNNKEEYDNQNRVIDLYAPLLSLTTKIDTLTAYQISGNNIVYMFTCDTNGRYLRTKINEIWVFYEETPGGNINPEIRPYKEFVYYKSAVPY